MFCKGFFDLVDHFDVFVEFGVAFDSAARVVQVGKHADFVVFAHNLTNDKRWAHCVTSMSLADNAIIQPFGKESTVFYDADAQYFVAVIERQPPLLLKQVLGLIARFCKHEDFLAASPRFKTHHPFVHHVVSLNKYGMTIVANPPSPYDNGVFEQLTEMNLTVSFYNEESTGSTTDPDTGETTETSSQNPITVVSAVPEHGGISVAVLNNTITITGKFSGVFNTPISYKTTSGVYKTIKSFSELPTAYDFIYRYIAPMVNAKISKITVTFDDDSTYDYEVVVYYDRAYIARQIFKPAVDMGHY